jgi:hypothetical protein
MVESNTSSDKGLANSLDNDYDKIAVCAICSKTLKLASLRKHTKRMHSDAVKPPTAEQPAQDEGKRPVTCEVCNKQLTRQSLRKHMRRLHPKLAYPSRPTHDSSEGNPVKCKKTSDKDHDDLSEVPTTLSQDSKAGESTGFKCDCGASFDKKIYLQVHETLYHKSFSALKRCERAGCFGLFLNDQIYSQHKTCAH